MPLTVSRTTAAWPALRAHELGREACVIGRVEAAGKNLAPVVLETVIGGQRPLDMLSGADLPRIC